MMAFFGQWFLIFVLMFLAWPAGFIFGHEVGIATVALALFLTAVWRGPESAVGLGVFVLILFGIISGDYLPAQ
jgi:hypothetical protein